MPNRRALSKLAAALAVSGRFLLYVQYLDPVSKTPATAASMAA